MAAAPDRARCQVSARREETITTLLQRPGDRTAFPCPGGPAGQGPGCEAVREGVAGRLLCSSAAHAQECASRRSRSCAPSSVRRGGISWRGQAGTIVVATAPGTARRRSHRWAGRDVRSQHACFLRSWRCAGGSPVRPQTAANRRPVHRRSRRELRYTPHATTLGNTRQRPAGVSGDLMLRAGCARVRG
jgi:hypothetical protein